MDSRLEIPPLPLSAPLLEVVREQVAIAEAVGLHTYGRDPWRDFLRRRPDAWPELSACAGPVPLAAE